MRAKYYREDRPRHPEEITDILGAIIERVGTGAHRDAGALIEGCEPVGIRDGVLLVEVQTGAAASLLRHDTAALLARISERLGPGVVEAVKLRVSRAPRTSKTP